MFVEDCDLIHNNGGALSVHLGGPGVVEDATYRNVRIECDGFEECSVMQRDREQKVECKKGNVCSWLVASNDKMFKQNGMYGTKHDFSKDPHGMVQKLTVDNISIRRTNGSPMPRARISSEESSLFGSLLLSNVTLDGASLELSGEEIKGMRRSFANVLLEVPEHVD